MEKHKLIPFKTIDLYKMLGKDEFYKLKSTSDFESLCGRIFDLEKTCSYESNRGDLVYRHHDGIKHKEVRKEYWDHKNCKVISENQGGQDYFLKVKYSNVYSKLWIQIAMRELDNIMKHLKQDHGLTLLRYKTEFNIGDIRDIDTKIGYLKHSNKLDGIELVTDSYCLKNDMKFYDFCDHLCRYNIRKYGNLLLVHDRPNYDYESVHKLKQWEEDGQSWFSTLPKGTQYLLTPIDINKSLTYLDYIGFGGFKVVVNKFPAKKDIVAPDEMKPFFDELDYVIKIIEYQNDIDEHNYYCNLHSRLVKSHRHYKEYVRDKWNFYEFEKSHPEFSNSHRVLS